MTSSLLEEGWSSPIGHFLIREAFLSETTTQRNALILLNKLKLSQMDGRGHQWKDFAQCENLKRLTLKYVYFESVSNEICLLI